MQGNGDINKIKNNMFNNIIRARDNYLTIKNSVLSPYNNVDISYNYYIDSLKTLSMQLEENRRELFSLTKKIELSHDDICSIDELNNNSILLYNIINGFGKAYSSYLFNLNVSYSFDKYSADTKALFMLEKNIPYLNYK
ncbi:MAG: hypothetical protein CBD77_04570 [bacterium TMED217]|nr:MAG: hypothetical protein CBD77_04570 [bacterium TMED217]|tara:strand:- start:19071 stop:19487 length:417 start_codon:yes stop_codon:yes gene_type:complete